MNDNVLKMARVILDNPSAGARELADALGYSEPKTVYYWLNKDGLRGVKELRRRVLRGEVLPFAAGGRRQAAERLAPYGGRLPLAVSLTGRGEPVFGDLEVALPRTSASAFAMHWSAALPPPLAAESVLVVDPGADVSDGDLVLALDPDGAPGLWRLYGRLLVSAVDPRRVLDGDGAAVRRVGRVLQVVTTAP
jgi:hypothetical protein